MRSIGCAIRDSLLNLKDWGNFSFVPSFVYHRYQYPILLNALLNVFWGLCNEILRYCRYDGIES